MIFLKTYISIDPLQIHRVNPDSFYDGFIFKGVIHNFGFVKLSGGRFIKKGKFSPWAFSWGNSEVWIYYPNPTVPMMTRSQGISLLANNLDFIWRHTDDPEIVLNPHYKTISTEENYYYQHREFEIDQKIILREEPLHPKLSPFIVDHTPFDTATRTFHPKVKKFYPIYVRKKHEQAK